MFTSRGLVFVALNAIRALSLITLLLVFVSNILVIVHDVQAVNHFMATQGADTTNSTTFDDTMANCDYIEGSTVPNQPAGVFWAVVNRLLILLECIFLALSEVGFPMRFFDTHFPVLGSNFGVGALGVFQCLIGASVLSHHVDTFALVSAFFVFSVGCVNMLAGLIFREGSKSKRVLNPAKSDIPVSINSNPNLKPMITSFPDGFMNVTNSRYSSSSTEKTPAPAYGYQAGNAFGRAGEKTGSPALLARSMTNISQPEPAHPNFRPTVTFNNNTRASGGSPSFESSPGNAV